MPDSYYFNLVNLVFVNLAESAYINIQPLESPSDCFDSFYIYQPLPLDFFSVQLYYAA